MTILTIEQYESSKRLLRILGKFVDKKSLQKFNIFIIEEEGPNWEMCDDCMDLKVDCQCDDESLHGRYYAEYDDEASFE